MESTIAAAGMVPITDLFAKTWRVFKERWRVLIGLSLIQALVTVVVMGLIFAAVLGSAVGFDWRALLGGNEQVFQQIGSQLESGGWNVLFGAAALAMVLGVLIYSLFTGALLYAVYRQSATIMESLSFGWRKLLSLFLATLLLVILIGAGFIAFIIPGIYLAVTLGFALYILVAEDTLALAAIKKSWLLVRGYWWAVFARFLQVRQVATG
jgi:hypothetical protein